MQKNIGLVFVVVGIFAMGCNRALTAPELKPDIGPGKAFQYLRPQGWRGSGQVEVGGNSGSIELTSGTGLVRIGADLTGSLQGDILTASNNQMGGAADALPGGLGALARASTKPAVEKLHDLQAVSLGKKFQDFKDGKLQQLSSKMGEGRFSEFTASDGGVALHGYRVTILGSDKRYTVRAQCAQSDWNTLRPVYEKIIQSIAPGPEN